LFQDGSDPGLDRGYCIAALRALVARSLEHRRPDGRYQLVNHAAIDFPRSCPDMADVEGDPAMAWAATDPFFTAPDTMARLARLRRLAWMIDGVFSLPGTRFRFGLNSVIGLLPVGGDAVLGAISLYIIYEAVQLGVPRHKLGRMLANVGAEVLGGSVPIMGDMFTMALKANLRNLAIIEEHVRGASWAPR
jgi:hypothetical protein